MTTSKSSPSSSKPLDNDGDAYNGIVITPDEMHALFSDDNFDLEAITKEELVQLLLDNGLTPS